MAHIKISITFAVVDAIVSFILFRENIMSVIIVNVITAAIVIAIFSKK